MVYIFSAGCDWMDSLFRDAEESGVAVISKDDISPFPISGTTKFLCKLMLSKRINSMIPLSNVAGPWLFDRLIPKAMESKLKKGDIFLFSTGNRFTYDSAFLKYCKRKYPDVALVRWFTDLVNIHNCCNIEGDEIAFCKEHYDHIITYDAVEAKKYGITYIETPYAKDSNVTLPEPGSVPKYDVVFVGKAKLNLDPQRFHTIMAVYRHLKQHGLRLCFYIVDVPEELQIQTDDIVYNQFLSYADVLKLNLESKCILEVSQKGESGTTLRMFEAIAYNRRLLLNNPHLVAHELFSTEHMHYFKEASDIDINFIIDEASVCYDYADKLSVHHYLSKLNQLIQK